MPLINFHHYAALKPWCLLIKAAKLVHSHSIFKSNNFKFFSCFFYSLVGVSGGWPLQLQFSCVTYLLYCCLNHWGTLEYACVQFSIQPDKKSLINQTNLLWLNQNSLPKTVSLYSLLVYFHFLQSVTMEPFFSSTSCFIESGNGCTLTLSSAPLGHQHCGDFTWQFTRLWVSLALSGPN